MKVLYVSLQSLSPLYQATETELISNSLAAGEEVWVLTCPGALSTCMFNPTHNLIGCALCSHRSNKWALRAGVPERQLLKIDRSCFPPPSDVELPASDDAFLGLEYEGINVGRGAASSTISILREYALDYGGKHRGLIQLEVSNAIGCLRNYLRVIGSLAPDRVVVFNGRHSEMWPLLSLCESRGIDYVTYERGSANERYQLFRNSLPHSIKTRRGLMNKLWAETPVEQRTAEATEWFESKRRGTNKDDKNYLGGQSVGALPDNYDADKRNFVVFNSSEDEMQVISEWKTPLYRQQNEVVARLLSTLGSDDNIHVYIRMHPNLKGIDNQQTRELYAMSAANLTLLHPEDPVDTYALVEAADVVLTFASTVGVEATFWGTPSILYGRSFYEGDDAVYQPTSFGALVELIRDGELAPKPKANVLKYGYFISHFGAPYAGAEVRSIKDVRINGRRVRRLSVGALRKLAGLLPQLPRWLRTHRVVTGNRLRLRELGKLYSHLTQER